MTLKGYAGELPETYLLVRAAKYLGVAPWELLEQPEYWLYFALEYQSVDDEVASILRKHR